MVEELTMGGAHNDCMRFYGIENSTRYTVRQRSLRLVWAVTCRSFFPGCGGRR